MFRKYPSWRSILPSARARDHADSDGRKGQPSYLLVASPRLGQARLRNTLFSLRSETRLAPSATIKGGGKFAIGLDASRLSLCACLGDYRQEFSDTAYSDVLKSAWIACQRRRFVRSRLLSALSSCRSETGFCRNMCARSFSKASTLVVSFFT